MAFPVQTEPWPLWWIVEACADQTLDGAVVDYSSSVCDRLIFDLMVSRKLYSNFSRSVAVALRPARAYLSGDLTHSSMKWEKVLSVSVHTSISLEYLLDFLISVSQK